MSKKVENDLALFNTSKPRDFNPHPLFAEFVKASNSVKQENLASNY